MCPRSRRENLGGAYISDLMLKHSACVGGVFLVEL